jgi:hypothetical protein
MMNDGPQMPLSFGGLQWNLLWLSSRETEMGRCVQDNPSFQGMDHFDPQKKMIKHLQIID